ncbi:MAG: tRNA glutamyl-Q(34) synthetase GluQRS, partial [Desulfovibrio sp.]|nr:tRNA glutamyl-Q(34) synthetase GluQRS [Desulfovibrio sp.]
WDEGPTPEKEIGAYHQSNRFRLYEDALQELVAKGLAYPCFCSRKDVRGMASAPHIGDAGAAYPGTCRRMPPAEAARRIARRERFSWRFRSTDKVFRFEDGLYGLQEASLADCGGDFNLRRSDGVFSYQLAVSVDDALMGVTQVVRGRDILPSTPRQLALMEALGWEAPSYVHIPLLLDAEGERLAKRHASLSLRSLRDEGVSPWRVVGLLARAAGLCDRLEEVHPRDLVHSFHFSTMRPADYTLSDNDMAWLTGREAGSWQAP